MGIINNDGDIILDCVLTKIGRERLARGDGSFKINKFALEDTEIDYSLFNKNHPSGSAYFDLAIASSPILEAITDQDAAMKSKLISIARTNLLFLPVIKVNTLDPAALNMVSGTFLVAVDQNTLDDFALTANKTVLKNIYINGLNPGAGNPIRIDQGLDTPNIAPESGMDADLVETQYIVNIRDDFGKLVDSTGKPATPSFTDDVPVSSYFVTLSSNSKFVISNPGAVSSKSHFQAIQGPRGTILSLSIASSMNLQNSTYLFTTYGSTATGATLFGGTSTSYYYLDSYLEVEGASTGVTLEVPIRYIKKV